jgi:hypothetical protein
MNFPKFLFEIAVELQYLNRPDDGLDREFNSSNQLEAGVGTMCAPGDQRESRDNQGEQHVERASLSVTRRC